MPKELISDFIAGWLAGGVGLLVGHPLDTIKVRLQTLSYGGVVNCVVTTMKQEAVNGFYKGMFAPFMSVGFLHSLYFASYGATLKFLNPHLDTKHKSFDAPFSQVFLASSVGASVQWMVAVPIEITKTKLQVQRENIGHFWESRHYHPANNRLYTGPLHCFHRIYHEFGLKRGLYRAGTVMYLRDVGGFSLYLPVYEFLQRKLRGKNSDYKLFATLVAGGAAGTTSWLSILPLDTVKSRVQGQNWDNPKFKGAWDCAKVSYREEGWRVFFRGGSVVAMRAFPVNSVLFLVYARVLEYLDGSLIFRNA